MRFEKCAQTHKNALFTFCHSLICLSCQPSLSHSLTLTFCTFHLHQDGQGYLEDLVRDMVSWLSSSSGLKPERCLQSNGLLTTLSQHYFLFLGTLSAHPQGVKLLEKCGLFQWWVYRKQTRIVLTCRTSALLKSQTSVWLMYFLGICQQFFDFCFCSLLNLCSVKNQDAVLKLAVATLDYSRDGLARVILSKILTAATDVRQPQQ